MEALRKIQQIGKCQNTHTMKLNELEEDHLYPVKEFKSINTKIGKRIIVFLKDKKDEFKVFLPERFSKGLDKKEIKNLNSQNKSLIYKEIKDLKDGEKMHIIDFPENKDDVDDDESDNNKSDSE